MRSLAQNEINVVSGASGEDVLAAGLILSAVGIGLMTTPTYAYYPSYPSYTYGYDVVTPVYDPYGRYVGDYVDSYYYNDYYYTPYYIY